MRETIKIDLTKSKQECEVITYFTRGETNQIQAITFEGIKMKSKGHENQEFEMNFENTLKAKEKTLQLAIKTLNGKPATIQEINNLPESDAKIIEDYINSITEIDKKKLETNLNE